jgi:aminopeptidase N
MPRRPWNVLFLLALLVVSSPAWGQTKLGPFTSEPRSVRSRQVDMLHTRLEFQFDWAKEEVRGRATHRFRPFAPLKQLQLDASKMTIQAVSLVPADSSAAPVGLRHELHGQSLAIDLDREYGPAEELTVRIDYLIQKPQRGFHFVNPDAHEPNQQQIIWTQSQPEDAKCWFPCFDNPGERMTSEVLVRVPGDFLVLSNGVLKERTIHGDGSRTWHWVQDQTHAPYLISVVAGRFEAYEQRFEDIPIVAYVPPGRLADAERSFGKTPAMMQYFGQKIGVRYPWAKYAQICCDEYGGGMEHTSATTLTLETLHDEKAHLDVSSDNLVAHELAHQWWGDLLTCKDWAELWLNESFATYFATLWTEYDRGWDEAAYQRYQEAQSYLDEDRQQYRRPIVSYRYQTGWNMFDRHSYPKGARVLHMLRYVLGDEAFWRALKHYCQKHAYGVVETADLRVAIEESTGQGLNWFFDQWIYHGGHPEFEVSYTWDESEKLVRLKVKQVQTVDALTTLFRMPIAIELVTPSQTVTRKVTVSKAEETFHLALEQRPVRVCFDPQDWVLKTLKFSKSKEELLNQLAHSQHIICRLQAVQGLGELRPDRDAFEALARAAREDKFWAIRQEAVRHVARFGGDDARKTLIAAAGQDEKSFVRRAAISSLADFPHDDTRTLLRQATANDPSYFAVAAALSALVKVDRDGCAADLLAALERPSHDEVILDAAANGLAEIEHPAALEKLLAILNPPAPPERRSAVLTAVAKLGRGDSKITQAIAQQLDDPRRGIRARAIAALGETGDSGAIEILLAQRDKVQRGAALAAIDQAIEKLRRSTSLDKVQQELANLKMENQRLEERLKALEKIIEGKGP